MIVNGHLFLERVSCRGWVLVLGFCSGVGESHYTLYRSLENDQSKSSNNLRIF